MKLPLVSIGMPTYNRADLFREALALARAQDYPNLEIIVSDNHSTDDTERVAREVVAVDPRVRYHRQPRNIGLHANLNFCLDQARGDLLSFFMDDDRYQPTIVREYAEFLGRHPEAGIVCSDYELLDERGVQVDVRDHPVPEVMSGFDFIGRTIRSGRSAGIGAPGMMVRQEALGTIRFDEAAPIGFGDYVVWFRIAERWAVGHIRRRLWGFRTHRNALSTRPVHSVARDYDQQISAYCNDYLRRCPDQAPVVEGWRRAMRRYLFWAIAYELLLHERSSETDSQRGHRTIFELSRYRLSAAEQGEARTQLRQYSRGPAQAVIARGLDVLAGSPIVRPLVWASRYSESVRVMLGLR